MAGKNLIVARNPARRKARRTAAQKAASRRNIKKAQSARRRRPSRRRRTTTRRRRRNPYPANRSYRRRSNPRNPFKGIVNNQVMPALIGGGGAVLNDLLVNMLPLPAQFKTGWMRHLSKAAGAIAIGFVGRMVVNTRTADQLGAGAMTVVGYNVVRDLAAQFAPQIPLGEYLTMGEYLDPALGYYGAGLNPSAVPGAGLETAGQFTRGSPYLGPSSDMLEAWPTGSSYDDMQY